MILQAVVGVLFLSGVKVPIPYQLELSLVAVAGILGGGISGLIAGVFGALLEIAGFFLDVGETGNYPAIRDPLSLGLSVILIVGTGGLLGRIRDNLESILDEFRSSNSAMQDEATAAGIEAETRASALEVVENRLELAQNRLRRVTRRWFDAQEADRRRLARLLHDDIGQSLTALRINLESNKRLLAADPSAEKFVETCYRLVDEIIVSVRELSLDLRPSLIDDLGLVAALRDYAGKQFSRAGITFEFDVYGDDSAIESSRGISIYRIAQEIIANILEHAKANNVTLTITITPAKLNMTFTDDGVGFDTSPEKTDSGHFGLASMRERAGLEDGKVLIDSEQGGGTTVQVTIPLTADKEAQRA